ncbi:hypothetical protein Tco_0751864 [Tanacetum coccineum]|uniref:Uncharacterized protein n=1 Tax=Tanacetum coccineum TaxID=301880 RepID=A0ABQ4Z8S4_9ASTR
MDVDGATEASLGFVATHPDLKYPENHGRVKWIWKVQTVHVRTMLLREKSLCDAIGIPFALQGIEKSLAENECAIEEIEYSRFRDYIGHCSCKVTFDGKISESQWKLLDKTQDSEERSFSLARNFFLFWYKFSLVLEDNIEFKEFGLHDNVAQFCVLKGSMPFFVVVSSTVAKLQDKLTTLEQIHEECPHHSKVREGKWSSKMENIVADLNSCTLDLESKEAHFKDITTEVDDLNSLPLAVHAPTPATAYGGRPVYGGNSGYSCF